jgi:IS5 family transposase
VRPEADISDFPTFGEPVETLDEAQARRSHSQTSKRENAELKGQNAELHGHKSHNRRFDGYKAHVSVDPDSELIDEVVVTPANAHDATAVNDLVAPVAGEKHKPTVMGDSAYAGARPKVERKIAHFVRVAWGGRKARTRGQRRVATDVDTRAAAVNWARLATLGVRTIDGAWAVVPP